MPLSRVASVGSARFEYVMAGNNQMALRVGGRE